jgi:hypothetical protein
MAPIVTFDVGPYHADIRHLGNAVNNYLATVALS